jgi:hypothetical protein
MTMHTNHSPKSVKTRKLTLNDVRVLEEVHATTARDFASELLGGDPFQAQSVADRIFDSMVGMEIEAVASAEKLPAWIADQVVRQCLEQTGNGRVADRLDALSRYRRRRRSRKASAPHAAVLPLRR